MANLSTAVPLGPTTGSTDVPVLEQDQINTVEATIKPIIPLFNLTFQFLVDATIDPFWIKMGIVFFIKMNGGEVLLRFGQFLSSLAI